MNDLTSYSSTQSDDGRRFVIKRIDADDIEISNTERMFLLEALNRGVRFIQIQDYTLMLNAIKSIDPIRERKQSFPVDFIGDMDFKQLPMSEAERTQAMLNVKKAREIFERKTHGK